MKPKPFIFARRIPIPILPPLSLSPHQSFTFSTHTRHSFDDVVPGRSAVYHHALKFQRPPTIWWTPRLANAATFVGHVTREPAPANTGNGSFGVYTVLRVWRSDQSHTSYFRVLLMMWNSVAELAWEHLKLNDFIYVKGCLQSYTKPDASGKLQLNYKGQRTKKEECQGEFNEILGGVSLDVKDFKFVAQSSDYWGHKKLKSVKAGMRSNQRRLYLWQVFFANPNEWWDQRERKLNPKQPDFRHQDTGEALWLSKYDPPWVQRQLQLLDSNHAIGSTGRSRVSNWVYDE
ncbi:hypothetical protein Fmac_032502 [Flemingia macrophylla]|uniref:Protein OSB1, mitochondrial n=1 Tax=Flemingia macrophylla TaxID=520843 RepID=A0ABD1L533_9FABA